MRPPRPPDWIVYAGAVLALVVVAVAKQEHADAPEAPPPMAEPGVVLGLTPEMRATPMRRLPSQGRERATGTAFSVSEAGVWLTARHVVNGCRRAAVLVSADRGVEAKVTSDRRSDVAVLVTEGGAPALPLAPPGRPEPGQLAFHPGFPQGGPGEVASRLLGSYRLHGLRRGDQARDVLAWAEVGRTQDLTGSLSGLSGAPVLDRAGRVIGVTLAESPRRGRLYSASAADIRAALALAGAVPADFARGQLLNRFNYGRAADGLRRDLRVAPVACLD